jgi:hypothetical protein
MKDRDHLDEAEKLRARIYRDMAPADRLRQALRMSARMRAMMDAALKAEHPDWTAEERRRCIAERILYARTG